ncbi:MAG: hypothetical protein M0004_11380 [Actinomycetota bacterium]|nr:hypothetical protein [Actinomycetota bacterium]
MRTRPADLKAAASARHDGVARWLRRSGASGVMSKRAARQLGRRFDTIEREVAAERAASALERLAELSRSGARVLAVRGAPARARSGRVEATLTTADRTRLVLRDVAVDQLAAAKARVEHAPLEIVGGAMPGARVVVVLSGRHGTCQLSGSRLEVIVDPGD